MAEKECHLYRVYRVYTYYHSDGRTDEKKEYCGTTTAVSEAKAIRNVRHRKIGNRPQYPIYEFSHDESADISWVAELVW